MKKLLSLLAGFSGLLASAAPNDIYFSQANATTGTAVIQTTVAGTPASLMAVSSAGKASTINNIALQNFGAVGDGVTDDTAAITAAIAFAAPGSTVNGGGLTYATTGISVTKSLILKGANFVALNPPAPSTNQKLFNIAAANVTLDHCNALIVPGHLPNDRNAAGVYDNGFSGLTISGGTYNGSINNATDYNNGIFYSPIQVLSASMIVVDGVTALNAGLEQIYLWTCTDAFIRNCYSSNSGNSAIAVDYGDRVEVLGCNINGTGASGVSFNSPDGVVDSNYISNTQTNGITLGHSRVVGIGLQATNVICTNNHITNAGISTTYAPPYASILLQTPNGALVSHNFVNPSFNNTGISKYCHGIYVVGEPVSGVTTTADINHNWISTPSGSGIYVADGFNLATIQVRDNTIASPWFYGVTAVGFSYLTCDRNYITQPSRAGSSAAIGIYLDQGVASGSSTLAQVEDNIILDTTPNEQFGIYQTSAFGNSFVLQLYRNTVRGWVSGSIVTSRSFVYQQGMNDTAGTAITVPSVSGIPSSGQVAVNLGSGGLAGYAGFTSDSSGNVTANSVTTGVAGSTAIAVNGAPGTAVSSNLLEKSVGSIADNTPTNVLTVTIPNGAESASVTCNMVASLGAGGAIGANEASSIATYTFVVTRTAGVAAAVAAPGAAQTTGVIVAGASTITFTAAASSISGAVGATNTFTVQVTIHHASGSSTNHTCLVKAEVFNANASGVTIN